MQVVTVIKISLIYIKSISISSYFLAILYKYQNLHQTVYFGPLNKILMFFILESEDVCVCVCQGELLSPCRCSGSVRSTHQPCLIKWISERGSWTCELCYYKYQVIAISTKNPLQWQAISLTVIEKVQIAAAILGSLFLIASISWLVSVTGCTASWTSSASVPLIVHEGRSVFRIFHRWQAVNQQWKVLNYDKKRDSEEVKKSEELKRSLLHQREPVRVDVSPSPSSLMVSAGTPALDVTDGTTQDPTGTDGPALPEQHCPYNLRYLLSHLRPHEPRSSPSPVGTNTTKPREVVMRVTTV
ncbi:hypothetical protein PO909_032964 [Leuciscus waleckii]